MAKRGGPCGPTRGPLVKSAGLAAGSANSQEKKIWHLAVTRQRN